MPQISRLGHVGLFCNDLMKMRRFYSEVLGLTITDEDMERGIVFLSADPQAEHHELALARAKDPSQKTTNVQQVSFKVKSLDDVRGFYHRLQQEGLRIDRTVTHGIACSVYFHDPEDNRVELYYTTPYNVRQPLGAPIDLDKANEELLEFLAEFFGVKKSGVSILRGEKGKEKTVQIEGRPEHELEDVMDAIP